jgi:Zn finger protein HypA/HybF involved in hydrogenase expression
MHKLSLTADLIRKRDSIAHEQHPAKIIDVTIKLGALTHVSVPHLREHFVQACRGTPLESTRLAMEIGTDLSDLHAQDILFHRVHGEG